MPKTGIYEQLINRALDRALQGVDKEQKYVKEISGDEASAVISRYLFEVISSSIRALKLESQVKLANNIIDVVQGYNKENLDLEIPDNPYELLAYIDRDQASPYAFKAAKDLVRPRTSLSTSTLFTGGDKGIELYDEIGKEIETADSVDFLVSFIKLSGYNLILENLKRFTERGGRLRVIATTYMGATDAQAIIALSELPNTEIKISYDADRTRLHAKVYIFHRNSGFSTAYIGSSNLTRPAMTSGCEWNLKISERELPDTLKKVNDTFDVYWHADEFESFTKDNSSKLEEALKPENWSGGNKRINLGYNAFFNINPYPYQETILNKLENERLKGNFRNLVVAATGTGKTVMCALDYRRFVQREPKGRHRLLFVAHREEILEQSISTFRNVLRDANFGDLLVGNNVPSAYEYLFASIQSINSKDFIKKFKPDDFDYIVVDEFHHAAAPTYRDLLTYFQPKILLGLTATPERHDGKDILQFFGGRIAAEIRLADAIDQKLLSPFQYYCVSDSISLKNLKWTRGRYDVNELDNLYSIDSYRAKNRAGEIVSALDKYVADIDRVHGIGFCVSIKHASFMANYFNSVGIPSAAVTGEDKSDIRASKQAEFKNGKLRFLFTVDLFNEGVDIPEINTILFLRPTESLTIFIQQLGRGLRLAEGKDHLIVLDFVGQANQRYDFEEKFKALVSSRERSIENQIEEGFTSLPAGCYIRLERKAKEYILENIRQKNRNKRMALIERIESFEYDYHVKPTLSLFMERVNQYEEAVSLSDIYNVELFSRLLVIAGKAETFPGGEEEKAIKRGFLRLSAIDSPEWISFLLRALPSLMDTPYESFSPRERRMLQMLYATFFLSGIKDYERDKERLFSILRCPQYYNEIIELLNYKFDIINRYKRPIVLNGDIPLEVHSTYTRDQILASFDEVQTSSVVAGVRYFDRFKTDIFFITLEKSEKNYSSTTCYNDYSISDVLFHWESQNSTAESSPTGQRYINHKKRGSDVLLFVRNRKTDSNGNTNPYIFLGKAEYVKHKGEKPMSIVWQLEEPIPPEVLTVTNKLGVV